ncbi:MAG: DEAD/DEAH box helicase family protein [Pirellulaceae bacterium]
MLTLRPYQDEAKSAVYQHLRTRDDNPCVVIPTGGGKTPLLASICTDSVTRWDGRVIVLAHVKELLEQSVDKLQRTCGELDVGVYSAGLGRRDTGHAVIVAGIQSVYKRACELDRFDLAIVDEAHMIPPEGEGMYRQFLAEAKVVNPQLRVIGMTATPFRLKSGLICTQDHFLNHVCYEVGVRELIRDAYLSPLITKAGSKKADTSGLHVRAGEFVPGEVEGLMDQDDLVESACAEIVKYTADRKAVLIFATGVKHGKHIVRVLGEKHGVECGFICAKTPVDDREELITRFKTGALKYLCNINVLTMGFDAPNVDCVALLRPTMSTGLYYQMVGRGFRLHPGKNNCLVLDFGGNVLRHGPVDQLRIEQFERGDGDAPAKECPECQSVIAAGYATCPDCGYEFPPPERRRHEAKASEAGVLSGQVTDTEYEVHDVTYSVHTKRGASDDDPKTLRVDYRLGLNHWQSEWVCFEHEGYARQKAVAWWRQRSRDPVPDTAERAVEIAEGGGLATTEKITVRNIAGEKYDRVVACKFGPLPEPVDVFGGYDPDEIPF